MALISSCKITKPESTAASANAGKTTQTTNNPIIKDKYTADPAALVYKDKVYLYVGHDQAPDDVNSYRMNEWLLYSSSDMVNWQEHPVPLKPADFAWAKGDAWASQVIERNGKFYWYVTVSHETIHGKSIGIAVSDSPTGPFKDAIGAPLWTKPYANDPCLFVDDNNKAYLYFHASGKDYHVAEMADDMLSIKGDFRR